MAEAMINAKDYAHARQQLEETLGKTERLGLRAESATTHYLLGTTLRSSGNANEAASHYREAVRLLDEIKKEAGAEKLLERTDLKSMYEESTHLAQAAKN